MGLESPAEHKGQALAAEREMPEQKHPRALLKRPRGPSQAPAEHPSECRGETLARDSSSAVLGVWAGYAEHPLSVQHPLSMLASLWQVVSQSSAGRSTEGISLPTAPCKVPTLSFMTSCWRVPVSVITDHYTAPEPSVYLKWLLILG